MGEGLKMTIAILLPGQTVRVRQGPYKGHIGVVKDATESTARVELHATCQTINVDRSRLQPTYVHYLRMLYEYMLCVCATISCADFRL